jgi:hypothetical protein
MRDQMAHDDSEDEDEEDYPYHSPSLSHSDFPPAIVSKKSMDDERSALPATASWAKSSTPDIPVNRTSVLPERALTPDAFGPPLAVAVAQQQQQHQQQRHQLSPSALKRKLEKKKRKELLQKQRREEELVTTPTIMTPTAIPSTTMNDCPPTSIEPIQKVEQKIIEQEEEEEEEDDDDQVLKYDGLVNFVLGDAFEEVCSPTKSKLEEEQPVGVSGLYEGSSDDDTPTTPPIDLSMSRLNLDDSMSPLEYLTQTIPTPSYTGTFNPFAHQLLRSVAVTTPNNTSNPSFDSPVRKHSRFGFAQV